MNREKLAKATSIRANRPGSPPNLRDSALAVFLTSVTFALSSGCHPAQVKGDDKSNSQQARQHCAIVVGERYCFDYKLTIVPGKEGVLLELPLGALDSSCNRTREIYPFESVLFTEGHIPDPEVLRRNNRDWDPEATINQFEQRDFLFRNSIAEYEECYPSKGGPPRITCQHTANWGGAYLKFGYDRQCKAEAKQFARDLEDMIEEAHQ